MENGQILPSKYCHFQYDHRFLFIRNGEHLMLKVGKAAKT